MSKLRSLTLCVLILSSTLVGEDEPPRCLDDRLKIELFAEHPDVVTPTGIDVDHLGRVFVIESNTHFPPDGYQGHPTDRILILENTDDDPRADKITVFADGLTHTMSVAVEPVWLRSPASRDKSPEPEKQPNPTFASSRLSTLDSRLNVFVATRNEILILSDTDGDSKADEKQRLVHLETAGNYPHNGLAGFAFDALGNMFFGFGENLGADYKIIGSDGTTLSGGGEGGNLYRCKPDGSKLERWATGFWNPHASCFDAFGRLFTVDNDADSRPPCRLLHIIPGGDYGYRFRNGRKGTHPFTSWNGEIPGTLPMVAGTGEAPSGIVCYENDGFPDDYLGTLLVGSWGDHRIDQFMLEPKGASFTSKAKPIIQGGENFRPVGLAVAPDGSLYFSDWVLKDYKLHGQGRVWRVSAKEEPRKDVVDAAKIEVHELRELKKYLLSPRMDIRRTACASALANHENVLQLLKAVKGDDGLRTRNPKAYDRLCHDLEIAVEQDMQVGGSSPKMKAQLEKLRKHLFFSGLFQIGNGEQQDFHDKHFTKMRSLILEQKPSVEAIIKQFGRDNRTEEDIEHRYEVLFTLAERDNFPKEVNLAKRRLRDNKLDIRRLAIQWIGEENLADLRPDVEALLADPHTTPDLFLACLATLQLLDGKPASEFEKQPPTQYIAALLKDSLSSPELRATALRMLPANSPELDAPLLTELLSSPDETLRIEATRTLASSQLPEARELLLEVAANSQASIRARAEAVVGLCNGPHEEPLPEPVETLLLNYARGEIPVETSDEAERSAAVKTLQIEALRSLRGRSAKEPRIREAIEKLKGNEELREAVGIALTGKPRTVSAVEAPRLPTVAFEGGDALAGRRVFYHHNGPLCARCHMVQGRGGQIGPDLTVIARTMDRDKLLASILEPSKEIAPQFTTWVIETTSGKTHTGFILEDNRTGQIKLGIATGEVLTLDEADIESREPSKLSVMPEKLHEQMTTQELRDLLAFLETLQ